MKRYKVFNITVTVLVFVGFVLLGIFVFRLSYCRSFEALIDLYGILSIISVTYSALKQVPFRA